MAIKLLIVDDSAFMRRIIANTVLEFDEVEVAGIARNGLDALEIIPKLKPDIITLDIEMPKLNGIEALKIIRERYNIPVIMLSSHTGTDITIEALEIGALDFIEKPADLKSNLSEFKSELEMKIKSVFPKKDKEKTLKNDRSLKENDNKIKEVKAVVIGASTGGPKALSYLINKLPDKIKVPIFIVQHMPKGFTASFAQRLDNECPIKVVEAEDGMITESNTVYLAPGDFHMIIEGRRIRLKDNEKLHGVRPAVDYLFNSAASVYKENLLGIIMTGMGRDGSQGMGNIKKMGGYNIAQDEESCIVYGMPGSAVSRKVVDIILSLDDISAKLNELIRVK